MRSMNTDTERNTLTFADGCPCADNILMRSHIDRVPWLIFTVEHIKIIMMIGHCKEVFGSCALIYGNQFLRVPFVCFPQGYPVFKPVFRRMSHSVYLIIIGAMTLHIHFSGIPVSVFSLALRSPVGPNTEFCITEPFRTLIVCQALWILMILALMYRLFFCIYFYYNVLRYRSSPHCHKQYHDR